MELKMNPVNLLMRYTIFIPVILIYYFNVDPYLNLFSLVTHKSK